MKHIVDEVETSTVDGVVVIRVVCSCGTPFRSRVDGEPAARRWRQHADACNGSRA